MGRAGSGRGFSEGGRSFLNRLDTRLPDELLRSVRNRPALVALCALLSLTVSGYAIAGETLRGLTIAPEFRCSPYLSRDNSYPQSVEAKIVT